MLLIAQGWALGFVSQRRPVGSSWWYEIFVPSVLTLSEVMKRRGRASCRAGTGSAWNTRTVALPPSSGRAKAGRNPHGAASAFVAVDAVRRDARRPRDKAAERPIPVLRCSRCHGPYVRPAAFRGRCAGTQRGPACPAEPAGSGGSAHEYVLTNILY